MYLLIDNYDSFTYNVYQYLSELKPGEIIVKRNDEITLSEIAGMNPEGIILSPGPGRPEDNGIIIDCIKEFKGKIPILGVCLGHQAIGQAFGGKVIKGSKIYHGKTDIIENDGKGLFRNLPPGLEAARYHSLIVEKETLPDELEITAFSSEGEIMGLRHKKYMIEGVQFHPESAASESGHHLLKNFLNYKRESLKPKEILTSIMKHKSLTFDEAADFMEELTEGNLNEVVISGFITAMNTKGASADEIAGCASVLMKKKVNIKASGKILDIVGTGGDELGSFNISSFAALISATAGAKVAKHGNRAVSSLSGSADFYRALGIPVDIKPEEAEKLIEKCGFSFLFAPFYHGAMRHAAPVRNKLGVKSIFNLLGPLINPASADYQLIGVYDRSLCRTIAQAAKMLGVKRVVVVHGFDGLDEISVSKPTRVVKIFEDGEEEVYIFEPEKAGIRTYPIEMLKGGSAAENAKEAEKLLKGEGNEAVRTSVCLNAGAALYLYGLAESIEEGYRISSETLSSGKVLEKVEELRSFA